MMQMTWLSKQWLNTSQKWFIFKMIYYHLLKIAYRWKEVRSFYFGTFNNGSAYSKSPVPNSYSETGDIPAAECNVFHKSRLLFFSLFFPHWWDQFKLILLKWLTSFCSGAPTLHKTFHWNHFYFGKPVPKVRFNPVILGGGGSAKPKLNTIVWLKFVCQCLPKLKYGKLCMGFVLVSSMK